MKRATLVESVSNVSRVVSVAIVALTAGCFRVDSNEVTLRDPHAVGVVGDANDVWLLPPGEPPAEVEVYRNAFLSAKLTRAPSGAIAYTSSHWALGERIDTTPLLDERGLTGWSSTPGASASLQRAIERGGEIRLHAVDFVRETGPFGLCNGTTFDSCITNPAVSMSLATDARNIEELRVHRTPLRGFGVVELIVGAAAVGLGATAIVVGAESQESDARAAVVSVGAGLALLGGLLGANGLWRVLTPDEDIVYRPAPRE